MERIVTLSLSTSKGVFHEKKVIPFFNLFVNLFIYFTKIDDYTGTFFIRLFTASVLS